jgi:uncharacterized protein YndB with AHSA1/START domain
MTGIWTHEFALPVAAPAARLFQALTTERELEQWFTEHARVEPRVGGAFRFWGRHTVGTPGPSDSRGAITVFRPDGQLGFTWAACGVPGTVVITLTAEDTPQGPGTRVAVRHELSGPLPLPRPRELIDDWWRLALGNLMVHATGQGEVLRPDFADPRPEIRLSMFVDAPRGAVFRALTEPDALREWMMAPAPVVELRVGGRYELGWKYEVEGREVSGGPMRILDLVPDERLVVSWPDWRGDAEVPVQSVTWLLEPEGAGTRVTLIHAGFVRAVDFSDYPFGWGHFMSEMAKVAVRFRE